MSLTEKILELLPEGTRPVKWVVDQIPNDAIQATDLDLIKIAKNNIENHLEGPHLIIVIDGSEINPRLDSQYITLAPDFGHPLKVVFGCTLGAIPGKLPYIFVNGIEGYLEDRWYERVNVPDYPMRFKNIDQVSAIAEPTGKIKVGEDGRMGEVYELRFEIGGY